MSWPQEVNLFEAYLEWRDESEEAADLREANVSTDFANYMSTLQNKRMMRSYREVSSTWTRWTTDYEVGDFKPVQTVGLTELPDLLPVDEEGAYKMSEIGERTGPSLTVKTYGRLWAITRKAIINDDMQQLRDYPARVGRAAARTLSRFVVKTLEGNGNYSDGVALFHASHNNLITDALSETGLQNAMLKLAQQTDDFGNPIELTGEFLLIPVGLTLTARRILESTEIHIQGSGNTPAYGQGNANVVEGAANVIVDRYLTDANDWYLFANPADVPVIAVGFLNGVRNPQVMLRDPGMRLVLGGSDPYTMDFDEMQWKIRHDWGSAIVDYRGAVKAAVA